MRNIYIICLLVMLMGCSFTSGEALGNRSLKSERFQESIRMGMTQDQIRARWGEPDRIIKKQDKDFDELWIYIPNWKFKNRLYFKKGILIKGDPNPEDLI